jgi:hypothetical protein
MEISNYAASVGLAVQVAVQKQMLDQMKTQGADVVKLIASASPGSANSPTQGRFVDAQA